MRIFLDEVDYRKFLYILGDVFDVCDIDCWDLCVMPNHYHLALMNHQPNLSRAMQHLNGEYATWWNAAHGVVGHTFQGRYKDQIVQREGYVMNLLRYIALNPVRAGLVRSPEMWPWSGYRWTAGFAPSPGLVRSEIVLSQFGDGPSAALRERYVRHIRATLVDDAERFQGLRSRRRVLGDRQFKSRVLTPLAPGAELSTTVAPLVAIGFP